MIIRPTCKDCNTQAVLRRTVTGQIQWRCLECDKVLGDKLFLNGVEVAEYLARFGKSITDIPSDTLPDQFNTGDCVICGLPESRTFSWFPPDEKGVVYLCDQHQQAFVTYWAGSFKAYQSDRFRTELSADTNELIGFAVDTMGAKVAG